MKFLFLGKAENEASTRYRIHPIRDCLNEVGHQVVFASTDVGLFAKFALLKQVADYDLVFVQRKLFPVWFLSVFKQRTKKLVFDFDDAIYLKSSGADSTTRHKKFRATCGAADLVLAGNQYLATEAKQFSNKVIVVPTTVDTATYSTEIYSIEAFSSETSPIENRKSEAITLVWIGSSSTRRYLDMLTPVLDQLAQRFPHLVVKVIADFEFTLDALEVKNISWAANTEVAELTSSHIGIAPMINNGWTRGKCALKVIQYMAAGLPVVSDRCGANQEVIVEGETGFLADNEHDWIEAIEKLVVDEDLRVKMGEAGRVRAQQLYDMRQVGLETAERLIELCEQRPN